METIVSAIIGAAALVLAAYISRTPSAPRKSSKRVGGQPEIQGSTPLDSTSAAFTVRRRSAALGLCAMAFALAGGVFYDLPFSFALSLGVSSGLVVLAASEQPKVTALVVLALATLWALYEAALLLRPWPAAGARSVLRWLTRGRS